MPRINLLPTRARAKLEAAQKEMAAVAAGIVFVLFALYLWHGVTQSRIEESATRSAAMGVNLTDLEKKVTQIETFKTEAAVLEKKIAIIDTLARSRSVPAQVLDGLAQVINDQPRIWLIKFVEKAGLLVLEGGAMEQEDVSSFHLALEKKATLFRDVKLTLVNTHQDKEAEYLKWVIACTPIYEAS